MTDALEAVRVWLPPPAVTAAEMGLVRPEWVEGLAVERFDASTRWAGFEFAYTSAGWWMPVVEAALESVVGFWAEIVRGSTVVVAVGSPGGRSSFLDEVGWGRPNPPPGDGYVGLRRSGAVWDYVVLDEVGPNPWPVDGADLGFGEAEVPVYDHDPLTGDDDAEDWDAVLGGPARGMLMVELLDDSTVEFLTRRDAKRAKR